MDTGLSWFEVIMYHDENAGGSMANAEIDDKSLLAIARLTTAWKFLSGEDRVFDFCLGQVQIPAYLEFCFVMPLCVLDRDEKFGVVVLIDRQSGLKVASHMFGMDETSVSETDIGDASSEVCNLLAAGMSQHFSKTKKVTAELPSRIDADTYQWICSKSQPIQKFESTTENSSLQIVVFDPLVVPN
jgi:hypothetical protein